MGNRRFVLLAILLLAALVVWQIPTLLKAIPSRYVAAYLPQPVQALAERSHVEVLPTAAVAAVAVDLLRAETATPVENEDPTLPAPLVTVIEPTSTRQSSNNESQVPATVRPTEQPPTETPAPTPIPIPVSARLSDFRHHFQTWNNCGPATLAMGLSYFNLPLTQDQTAAVLKPNPEDRNVSPYEMVAYVNDQTGLSALDRANGDLDTLRRLVANGFPVIVELGLDPPGEYRWMGWYGHYLLIVAYDDALEQLWVYDSWFGTSLVPGENADAQGRTVSYADLERYWSQFNRNYMVLYEPFEASDVAAIIGPEMDDSVMWQQALADVRGELSAAPDNAFLWFNLGTIYNALGEHEKAAAAFDQARAIGLPWRMLWYQFGPYEAYYNVGRYEDVILLAEVTLQDRPYFEESFYYLALAQAALGNSREASSNLEKAVRFNPNFAPAAEALAELDV